MKHKNAIIYGLLSGLLILLYHVTCYWGVKEWMVTTYFFFSIYILQFPFMLATGLSYRKMNGGLVDFRVALSGIVVTFLVGAVFYFGCYYAFFGFSEELVILQKEEVYKGIMKLQNIGVYDEDEIQKMIKSWETDDYKVGLIDVFQGVPFRIIGGFALSTIAALLVKR